MIFVAISVFLPKVHWQATDVFKFLLKLVSIENDSANPIPKWPGNDFCVGQYASALRICTYILFISGFKCNVTIISKCYQWKLWLKSDKWKLKFGWSAISCILWYARVCPCVASLYIYIAHYTISACPSFTFMSWWSHIIWLLVNICSVQEFPIVIDKINRGIYTNKMERVAVENIDKIEWGTFLSSCPWLSNRTNQKFAIENSAHVEMEIHMPFFSQGNICLHRWFKWIWCCIEIGRN